MIPQDNTFINLGTKELQSKHSVFTKGNYTKFSLTSSAFFIQKYTAISSPKHKGLAPI